MRHVTRLAGTYGSAGCLLMGCASAPDVTLTYYLPKVTMDISVTETVTCTDRNEPAIVSTIAVTPVYSRDDSKRFPIPTSALGSPFSDIDVTFNLSPDGRLTGINSTQTGQGTAIVKSLLAFGKSVGLPVQPYSLPVQPHSDLPAPQSGTVAACKKVRDIGKDKGVAVSFFAKETFSSDTVSEMLQPAGNSEALFEIVRPLLGTLYLKKTKGADLPATVAYNGNSSEVVMLPMVQPATYHLSIYRLVPPSEAVRGRTTPKTEQVLWTGDQAVPQQGKKYAIPIPKAALFGTQTVVVALDDSGAITSLKYGKTGGLSSAADAASTMAAQFKQQTAADKATEVKGEADLIVQQQRLAKCRASPADCT